MLLYLLNNKAGKFIDSTRMLRRGVGALRLSLPLPLFTLVIRWTFEIRISDCQASIATMLTPSFLCYHCIALYSLPTYPSPLRSLAICIWDDSDNGVASPPGLPLGLHLLFSFSFFHRSRSSPMLSVVGLLHFRPFLALGTCWSTFSMAGLRLEQEYLILCMYASTMRGLWQSDWG